MMVLDASAALDILTRSVRASAIEARISSERIQVPHLIDIEIAHVLRKHVSVGAMTSTHAETSLGLWLAADIDRHPHDTLLPRIWQLRPALTAYDAAYVALAEVLAVPLLTCDGRLARSHGHSAHIEWVT